MLLESVQIHLCVRFGVTRDINGLSVSVKPYTSLRTLHRYRFARCYLFVATHCLYMRPPRNDENINFPCGVSTPSSLER